VAGFRSLQTRVAVFFAILLVSVLGVTLVLIAKAGEGIARRQLAEELAVGERVLHSAIQRSNQQLVGAAAVLAADFGFREAVATRDIDTIDSVLRNHGKRIQADVVMLADLDLRLLADTRGSYDTGAQFPFGPLIRAAQDSGKTSGIVLIDAKPYQVVVLNVSAPLPIAWVAMGFAIDDRLARELAAVTGAQVSVLARTREREWSVAASTLAPAQRSELGALALAGTLARDGLTVLAGEAHQTVVAPLSDSMGGRVSAVLQRSLREGLAPFERLLVVLAGVGIVAVALSVAGSLMLARGIAQPIRLLAQTARQIREGDYQRAAMPEQQDEIAELAESFNHMVAGLQDREERIKDLAYRDRLTGLPNRLLFNELLDAQLRRTESGVPPVHVLLLDVDRFKLVNDTLGHPAGDQILRMLSDRLLELVDPGTVVARLGGDELAILCTSPDDAQARHLAQRILDGLDAPIAYAGQNIDVRVSIGIASPSRTNADASVLLRDADVAMYAAKRSHSGYVVYDPTHEEGRRGHLSLLSELKHGLENDELTLYFQPKVDLRTGAVEGAEALVRWQHPQRGFVSPAEFIPFAEQTGYIRHITHWVLERAMRQQKIWRECGVRLRVSVNISARDVSDDRFCESLSTLLDQAGVPAGCICLEITESGVMDDMARALVTLNRLHDLGFELAVDDYGTGYSSLSYLKKLPVQELKIDRSFVMNVTSDPDDEVIVRSTIELGHNMGLRVVAEGVESNEAMRMLARLGCDQVQGYVVSKPLPVDQFEAWLARMTSHPEARLAAAHRA